MSLREQFLKKFIYPSSIYRTSLFARCCANTDNVITVWKEGSTSRIFFKFFAFILKGHLLDLAVKQINFGILDLKFIFYDLRQVT